MKNILINNGALGRQGKTTIAYTIWQQVPGYKYITNDIENAQATVDIETKIPESQRLDVSDGGDFGVEADDKCIFDFGGKPDDRLLAIAKHVDLIIIPMTFLSTSELALTMRNINTYKTVNKNILLVLNNVEQKKLLELYRAITANTQAFDFQVLELSRSDFMHRLPNEGKTIYDVAAENKMAAGQLKKKLIPQFNKILEAVV
ncbi:hypothetical protein [Pseudoalteromonas rubra]|uniref:hypothetical protein n=1 Tax=Pseudoalteromonas rubra TaxID=43658 RepID=UPI002DBDFD32|nr:hypothetical protein [Pseudoalteromonas rubra]MEC4091622.1 hypothetical protein [Pseudoalteromonas rubra]